jgi:hypothetical protein
MRYFFLQLLGRDALRFSEVVVVTQGQQQAGPGSSHRGRQNPKHAPSLDHDDGPYGGVPPPGIRSVYGGMGDESDPIFETLPNAGAKVHAIQLSGEPHPRLKEITARSGGRFSAVEDASEEAAAFMELLSFYESVFQISNPSKVS